MLLSGTRACHPATLRTLGVITRSPLLLFQLPHDPVFVCEGGLQLPHEPACLQRTVELLKVLDMLRNAVLVNDRRASVLSVRASNVLLFGAVVHSVLLQLKSLEFNSARRALCLLVKALLKVQLRVQLETFPVAIVARNLSVHAFVLVRLQILVDAFPRASSVLAGHLNVPNLPIDIRCRKEERVVGFPLLSREGNTANCAGAEVLYVLLETLLAEQMAAFCALRIA